MRTALLVIVVATSAAAQEQAPTSHDATYEAARKRFDEGRRLIREGKREHNPAKLELAYVEFKEAFALYPHAKAALLNLVESELATNRALDAMRHLRGFVGEHGTPESATEYGRAFGQYWDSAYKATAHIVVDARPGVRVLVDKSELGVTPLAAEIDVTPGPHAIEGIEPDGEARSEVDAVAGATVKVTLEPAPSPAPTVVESSRVAPPAAVAAARSAPWPSPMPSQEGSRTFWTPTRRWGAALGGAGLAALSAGLVFAVQNKNDADHADTLSQQLGPTGCSGASSTDCQRLQSERNDQSRDFTLTTVFVGLGAVAIGTGGVLFLWHSPATSRVAVLPAVTPAGGGIQLRGEL